MGKLSKSSRKGKKAWRANISTDDFEDYFEKTTKDALSGGSLADVPSDSLFFVDKSRDLSIKRKIEKSRERVLRCDSMLQRNPFVQPVPSSIQKKNTSKKNKKSAEVAKEIDDSRHIRKAEGEPDSGMADLWTERGGESSKHKKKGKSSVIPAVEVEAEGCSFNPDPESHQDALARAVADEMQKIYRAELGPEPIPLIVRGEAIDDEDRYFLEAGGETDDEDQEGGDLTDDGDADKEKRTLKPKRVTRVELNRRAKRKEQLKAEEESKKTEALSKEIDSSAIGKMGIFEPYRAIGYVTTNVPFAVLRQNTETFVTVSVGKAFQVHKLFKTAGRKRDAFFKLESASPQLPNKIRALAAYREYTFAAYGHNIAVFLRTKLVATWESHNAKISYLLVFGDNVLSMDVKGSIFIWEFKGLKVNPSPVGHILLESNFTPTCLMHPDTYLDKVLIGSQEGSLQLWNIKNKRMIHEFKGWNSAVSCCVNSPALHVVAVGCSDGKIHIHNIQYDEEIVTFAHSTRDPVNSLSFRTDGEPLLASGGSSGIINIWNLEKRRLKSVISEAHDSSIVSLHFLAQEPVLLSSSTDNSIKLWVFQADGVDPYLRSFRKGHSAPPLCIKFHANGTNILSAGQDRAFRLFSIIQDQRSKELSQGHVTKRARKLKVNEMELKLKPVIAFDVCEIRERDWSNVVTCHMDTPRAYVWKLRDSVIGDHILSPNPDDPTPVKACAISACGNFAVVGTEGGWIERFNLQSGLSRGTYVDNSERKPCAHDGEVVGVACDSTNTLMISAGYHGDVKVWDFKGRALKSKIEIGGSLVKIVYHRYSGLLSIVSDDWVICLFDVVALRMVRKFEGHVDRITDMCFSEDGRWLLSSSMDGTLRIWDVILARQIDAMHVDVSVTALSLSPNMDFLATTHVGHNGIYLWANQLMFSAATKADNYGSGKNVVSIKLPSVSSDGNSSEGNFEKVKLNPSFTGSTLNDSMDLDVDRVSSQDLSEMHRQIPDLVTLSMLPKSQWQSLINLDVIKERNKPIEPPKKPEKAPFFLPSIPSFSGEILFKPRESSHDEKDNQSHDSEKQGRIDFPESHFLQILRSAAEENNFPAFTEYIKNLSPSALDMELRMLQIIDDDDGDDHESRKRPELYYIELVLDYFIQEISCRNNFEFIQAMIRLFLKIHGESVRSRPILQEKARKLLETQSAVWHKVDRLFQSTRCMVTFLSNSQF